MAVFRFTCARLRGSDLSLARFAELMCSMIQTHARATATNSGAGSTVLLQWVGKNVTAAIVDITLVVVGAPCGSIVCPASRAVGARERSKGEILADSQDLHATHITRATVGQCDHPRQKFEPLPRGFLGQGGRVNPVENSLFRPHVRTSAGLRFATLVSNWCD